MGEARRRGTKEERIKMAKKRVLEIGISNKEGEARIKMIYKLSRELGRSEIESMAISQAFQTMVTLYPNANPYDPKMMNEMIVRTVSNIQMWNKVGWETMRTFFADFMEI